MEKAIRTIILILSILLFLGMTNIVHLAYPFSSTIYAEFEKAYYLEECLEEILFTLLFLYAFLKSTGVRKGFACFGFFISFASMIDKVFNGIFDYIWTDVIILIIASIFGFLAYKRQ